MWLSNRKKNYEIIIDSIVYCIRIRILESFLFKKKSHGRKMIISALRYRVTIINLQFIVNTNI